MKENKYKLLEHIRFNKSINLQADKDVLETIINVVFDDDGVVSANTISAKKNGKNIKFKRL